MVFALLSIPQKQVCFSSALHLRNIEMIPKIEQFSSDPQKLSTKNVTSKKPFISLKTAKTAEIQNYEAQNISQANIHVLLIILHSDALYLLYIFNM